MKIVRRILIGLVLVTVLVPIAVFLVVVNFFSPEIKPMLVKLLNESTGGVVAIHGDLYAELGFTPTIGLRGLSLRNPQWNQNATLLTAEHASISFSLLPLFSRELVVNSIALDRAQLSLEQQGEKKNWVMSSSKTPPALAEEEGTQHASSFRSMPLNIGMVSVRDLTVHYKKDDVVQHLLIEQAKLILADKPTLSATLFYQNIVQGRINAHLHHPIASIKDVASWMQPATIEIDVEAGKNHATLHGEMTWKDEKPQFRGAIEAKIPSAYQLASLWGGDAHSTIKPLNAKTNVLATPTMVSLEELHMDYGSYAVDATMHVDYQGKKPILGGVVHMPRVTLERSVHQKVDDPSSTPSDAPKEVIHKKAKDDTIPFAMLNHVIVRDLQVQIDEILYGKDVVAKNVALPMALDKKTLAMRDAHAMVLGGMMRASLTVDARAMPATITVASTMDGMTLEQLARLAKRDNVKKGAVAFDGNFTSKVTHYSDFVPNLDGTLHYHVGSMQWVLSELTSDAAVLFQAVRGKNVEAKTVDMMCALGVWNIRHGKAKAELAVMDGTAGLIDLTGSVDLAYRQLALHMLAYPKQRALAQLPLPVTIDGSFDQPRIHADKKILLQHFEQLGATLSGKKPAIEKALASELGQRMRASGVDASCLRDLPSDALPATKEDFKALEDDVKQEIKDIGTHHKEEFKRIEDDVRGIRDALQGLRGKE